MLDAFGGRRRERLGLSPAGTILWFGVKCQIRLMVVELGLSMT